MTDTEMERREAICAVAGVDDIGELSDGFHTFNNLYEQRAILFAALVKAYKDKSWKSLRHEDGELCFGGGWFIVGIDTPEGSYTYHYENKYWNMFECIGLPRAKHWDGHTEADAETRLMSLEPQRWIPCSERLPEKDEEYYVTLENGCVKILGYATVQTLRYPKGFYYVTDDGIAWRQTMNPVIAWMPLLAPYREEGEK